MHGNKLCASFLLLLALLTLAAFPARSQWDTATDQQRALDMWSYVATEVERRYYDPQFHGIDWKRTVHETQQKIKSAPSLEVGMAYIEEALLSLNDSHTIFLPPGHHYLYDYGYRMEMIGDQCYVTRVRPGSDAEAKGLIPGDEVLGINGYQPVRKNLWTIDYRFNVLRTERAMQLVIRDPQGKTRQLEAMTKFKEFRYVSEMNREAENLKYLWLRVGARQAPMWAWWNSQHSCWSRRR